MAADDASNTDTTSEDAQARLIGMVVHEVSLVDRAANKRTFLIVKRDPMSKQIAKDGTASPGGTADTADGAASADAAAASGGGEAAGGAGPMQAQVKDGLLQALTGAAEKLVAVANSVKDSETSDAAQDPPVPAAIVGAIGEVASLLQQIAAQYGGGADGKAAAAMTGDNTPAHKEAADAEAELKAAVESGDVEKTALAMKRVTTARAAIAKVGRKMAKERLERFRKAIDLLAGLLKELTVDAARKNGGKPVLKGAAPGMVPAAEVAALLKSAEDIVGLAKARGTEIDALKKALAEANAENEAMRKAVGTPNSGGRAEAAAPKQVHWPLNMNRPPSTDPAVSFAARPK